MSGPQKAAPFSSSQTSLPAFITPNVLDVLVKNYNIMPIKTPDEDLQSILA